MLAGTMADNHQMNSPIDLYANYPFESDDAFKQGLAGIIARSPADADHDEISRKAKVFYFNRVTGSTLTVEEVEASEQASTQSPEFTTCASPTAADSPRHDSSSQQQETLTLTQIKEFIETGRTDQLPNNKVIPGGLNEAPPSQSIAATRKKPWEVDQ
ncbi:hypothetical protein WG66_001970 [Moniliophthora roreri]|nr:hypothetical protein WG66_001970 [Moniliophthora roreri]